MIIRELDPGFFEIEVIIKEKKYGNTDVDYITGWDKIESTTLKLKCTDCTIMVFKEDLILFRNISVGDSLRAYVKEWKENIYNFKQMANK
jgi:hypothetical protein